MDDKSTLPADAVRRKLLFRSWHRGTREMDLLLGRFAEAHLPDFTEGQLALYAELLQENDPDLYDWLSGKSEPPAHCRNEVMEKLLKFHASC
ncbi:MAG: succinate dehydrogenase assembly factor 2 [Proteobacteria bacterium]|nr:succinate dehydrogenase assembly factor 2 [Pseudomonadota bacterium]